MTCSENSANLPLCATFLRLANDGSGEFGKFGKYASWSPLLDLGTAHGHLEALQDLRQRDCRAIASLLIDSPPASDVVVVHRPRAACPVDRERVAVGQARRLEVVQVDGAKPWNRWVSEATCKIRWMRGC